MFQIFLLAANFRFHRQNISHATQTEKVPHAAAAPLYRQSDTTKK